MISKKTFKVVGIVAAVLCLLMFIVPWLIPAKVYRDMLIKQVESGINGKISVGDMKIKLFPLPGFTLKDISLSNTNGSFAGKELISAGEISGDVAIMPLFSKRLSFSLKLVKPSLFYRVARSGETNIDGIVPEKKADTTPQKPSEWALDVRGLSIDKGMMEYSKEGEKPLIIKNIDFKISDYSSDGKKITPIKLAASILGRKEQNFKVDGGALFNASDKIAKLEKFNISLDNTKVSVNGSASLDGNMPMDAKVNVSPINIAELRTYFPALIVVNTITDPKVSLVLKGPLKTPEKIGVSGQVSSSYIKYQDYEITAFKANASYSNGRVNLSSLTGSLYDGALNGSGELVMKGTPSYSTDVSITGVDVAKIPAVKGQIKGIGTFNVQASGSGVDEAAIKKNLKATGNIHLVSGDVPSLKLGEKIFGSPVWNILAAPGVILSQNGLAELRSLDASCQEFNMTFNVANGVINTPVVKWQNPKYRVNLAGSVTMNEELSYKGEFALYKAPTDNLLVNQSAKKILVNKAGELAVPFYVEGTVSDPKARPDEKYLTSLFTKAATAILVSNPLEIVPKAEEAGKKLLQGIFGR